MFMTISILVAGCSFEPTVEKKYTYKGESENWTGTYKLDYIVDFPIEDDKVYVHQKKNGSLYVSYKGDLSYLPKVKHFEISYKRSSGSGGMHTENSDDYFSLDRKEFRLDGGAGSKYEVGEHPLPLERMQNLYKMYTSYEEYIEKIDVVVDLDGKIENIELLLGEEPKLNSLDFNQISESLSKIGRPEQQLTHINTSVDLDLISSNITIKDEKSITYEEDDNKGQELVAKVLCYDFTVKNIGSRKVGRITNADDLHIQIVPNEKLKEVFREIFGIDVFDYDSLSNTGLSYGQSVEHDFLNNNEECKITFSFDLGVSEGGSPGTPTAPPADKLEKLQKYASEAALIIIYKDTEIAHFNLNEINDLQPVSQNDDYI